MEWGTTDPPSSTLPAQVAEFRRMTTAAERRTLALQYESLLTDVRAHGPVIGRGLRTFDRSRPSMALGFLEMIWAAASCCTSSPHCLGLVHEHQRADFLSKVVQLPWRDREAIHSKTHGTAEDIMRASGGKLVHSFEFDNSNSSVFDPDSIMMYVLDCNLFYRNPPLACNGTANCWYQTRPGVSITRRINLFSTSRRFRNQFPIVPAPITRVLRAHAASVHDGRRRRSC